LGLNAVIRCFCFARRKAKLVFRNSPYLYQMENHLNKSIVFYDGDCGFCNSSVQFVLNRRKRDVFFLPLQSDLAVGIMKKHGVTIEMNTMYFLHKGKLYDKSTAALKVNLLLRFPYPVFFYLGIIVPRFLRNWMYDQIAKRRHKIKNGFCALPKPEERRLFLD
jgi:predicted DCC family thiol-disulfide oxidoreductase YuxK